MLIDAGWGRRGSLAAVPEYPKRWESDVVLADGGTVRLRPVRPDDAAALLALYEQLSDASMYLRFFSPVSAGKAAELEHIAKVDYADRMTMVAQHEDELVAIARYDRVDSEQAEVAFTVRDDQQGRGLGTLLLEHLAVVARANGIRRFRADTLIDNFPMLGVFTEAGWHTTQQFTDGAIRVAFDIAPTLESLSAVEARETRAEAISVQRLLEPRSIAVIGASRRHGTIGHEVFRNLLLFDFQGPVYPVNPASESVAGVRAYASVVDVPDDVDLAAVVVPAAHVPEVVEECAAKRVHGLVVITAGFAEVGAEGDASQRQVLATVRRHGMRMIGPNCLGVVNTDPAVRMNATFAPTTPLRGRVAFSSQSGGLGIELMARAGALGLGVSHFVSVGNKADVSGNDLLQYWETDPNTDVILLYLESFGNPRKFARLARRISRAKPIIAVKSGRTIAGSRAASSHTAALASPDVAVDALFRQAGVIRVDTLEELLDTAEVASHQPLPPGRRVAIVSNAGGPGILAADACAGAGLDVSELSAPAQERLRSFVARDASVRNPVDLVAGATAADFERALRTVLDDDAIDAVLAIFVPPLVTTASDVARAIANAARAAGPKPVVASFLGQDGVPPELRGDEERRTVPSFAFPEAAARALGRLADLSDWRDEPVGTEPEFADIDAGRARELIAEQLAGAPAEGVWLDARTATRLLGCFGITTAPTAVVHDAESAAQVADELGYPVVLKAGSPEIVHKTDVGGVALGLQDAAAVRDAFEQMLARLGDKMGGAIVQATAPLGIETIVGVTQDPAFGPLVLFGLGGVAAELLADRSLALVPITDEDAHRLVRSLRSSPLLFGYRGAPSVDVGDLEQLLMRIGKLADELPEVVELDLNPVLVGSHGALPVDVKIRCVAAPPSMPQDFRRMRD